MIFYLQSGILAFIALMQIKWAYESYLSLKQFPPFYGIWAVESCNSTESPWKNIIFQSPGLITIQKDNGDLETYDVAIDLQNKSIHIKDGSIRPQLFYTEDLSSQKMTLKGSMNEASICWNLSRRNETEFTLLNRGFHWVSEYPYNR